MTDPIISLRDEPDDLQDRGATALTEAPVSFAGLLTDYANRPPRPASSLGILMDDQQMRDAGVHPEQLRAAPEHSIIDGTGAGGPKADPAGGYAKVIGMTRSMATGAHNVASWLGQAPIISNSLKAGQDIKSAIAQAGSHPVVAGLNGFHSSTLCGRKRGAGYK